jgi:hypothetical protein
MCGGLGPLWASAQHFRIDWNYRLGHAQQSFPPAAPLEIYRAFREYASAWINASREHLRPNPEWAFLSDRASKVAVADWKKLRRQKASKVLKVLSQISSK